MVKRNDDQTSSSPSKSDGVDDRLREILEDIISDGASTVATITSAESFMLAIGKNDVLGIDKAIAQIKQVFMDEGYHYPTTSGNKLLLTGQEWYERFVRILNSMESKDTNYPPGATVIPVWSGDDVLEAAKRASGLDDEVQINAEVRFGDGIT